MRSRVTLDRALEWRVRSGASVVARTVILMALLTVVLCNWPAGRLYAATDGFVLAQAHQAQSAQSSGQAARNPFLGAAPSGQNAQAGAQPRAAWLARAPSAGSAPAEMHQPGLWTRFWIWVETTQQALYRRLVHEVRIIKNGDSMFAGLGLIVASFIYGIVHAIGPGHGKAVISSYVLANERTARRGILLAFAASFVQALSAIVIIGVLAIALNAAGLRIREWAARLESASYALVALIGLWMLWAELGKRWRRWRTQRSSGQEPQAGSDASDHAHAHGAAHHSHNHAEGEACSCGFEHLPSAEALEKNWSLRRAAAIVFAVGVRPCSGALIVLVFALTQGLFWAGVAATFAMALGTAITVSSLAVLAVGSRNMAVRASGNGGIWATRIESAATLGGAAVVLLVGVVLFIGSLGPVRPF